MQRFTMVALTSLLMAGCGSDGESDSSNQDFTGYWYNAKGDSYIDIRSNGDMYGYKCTLNEGYQSDGSVTGKISGNQVTFTNDASDGTAQVTATRNGDTLTFNLTQTKDGKTFTAATSGTKTDQIPTICTGDAIEVTYASPTTATAGQETQFVVSFDYRLTSTAKATIQLAYPVDSDLEYLWPRNAILHLDKKGMGSGSFTATVTPEKLSNNKPYRLLLEMSQDLDNDDDTDKFDTDEVEVTILTTGN